ncbi:UDP-glucuronosyl/UDP-glucosyltransferase [Kitasatospora sp. MMS16-BH015]|uniref:glycosyltransferase n=1 Tax=Kitasatospora sp. MMS16-BH015 TaxID=2018025 RepID=UPI000CA29EAA|nr:glycosyltransferase [Kitasatospora sp. MMS16-BH015]AUG75897.1 UDP-glucuronosyl/UDP-glucosyltransferase [Kitasatospora sp. MMS16-BH015]
MARVVVISPPFHSHARPLATLGSALSRHGARVDFACTAAFADLAAHHGLGFTELAVTRNANHGTAEATRQDRAGTERLREFLDATRHGPTETLLTQARHRADDMLADPERVLHDLADLDRRLRPDWYLVDQLSYSATLALHGLALPYATFCPGHPSYLPASADAYFGFPYAWPDALRPSAEDLERLRGAAAANDAAFTAEFRAFTRRHAPGRPLPERAFALCSPHTVVFNYPRLPWLPPAPAGPRAVHAGHLLPDTGPAPLDGHWQAVLDRLTSGNRPLVPVALGTFLSARDDVLATAAAGILRHTPASVVVAAGERVAAVTANPLLRDADPARLHVAPVIPQQELLRHAGAMVHHGGNNSFTECLHAGVPALVLPFSSDQFAIAHDAERAGAGRCLDPNTLTPDAAGRAVAALLAGAAHGLPALSARERPHGPAWAAAALLQSMPARS